MGRRRPARGAGRRRDPAAAVPAPDFNDDGFADLAVGAPGETVGGKADAGAGSALFGADTGGLGNGGSQFFFSGGGLGGAAETGDLAGAAFS